MCGGTLPAVDGCDGINAEKAISLSTVFGSLSIRSIGIRTGSNSSIESIMFITISISFSINVPALEGLARAEEVLNVPPLSKLGVNLE